VFIFYSFLFSLLSPLSSLTLSVTHTLSLSIILYYFIMLYVKVRNEILDIFLNELVK